MAQQTPGSATPLGTAVGEAVESLDAIDRITASGVVRIGVPDDLPPFGARNTSGQLEGYDVDVANLLAKELGVRAELRPLRSGNRVASLLAHEVDLVVANLGVNPERAKSIAFSTPYAPFFSGVFGAPGVAAASPTELQGKRIAVTRDSLEDKELSTIAQGAEILRFDDNKATMDAYLAGQADLVATGNIVIADLAKRQPDKSIERKFVIRESPASIGVPRDQPHFLNWVNVFVFHKKLTGELDALARKWLGEPLPQLPIL
jgi:polar amino acid transport system substrate-binding protein